MKVAYGSLPLLNGGMNNLCIAFDDNGNPKGPRKVPIEVNDCITKQRKIFREMEEDLEKGIKNLQKQYCVMEEKEVGNGVKQEVPVTKMEQREGDTEELPYLVFKSELAEKMYGLEWRLLHAKETDVKIHRFSLAQLRPIGNIEPNVYNGIQFMMQGFDEKEWEKGQKAAFSNIEALREELEALSEQERLAAESEAEATEEAEERYHSEPEGAPA